MSAQELNERADTTYITVRVYLDEAHAWDAREIVAQALETSADVLATYEVLGGDDSLVFASLPLT